MEIIQVKVSELKPAEYNPRRLTNEQHAHLTESIKKFGLVDPIIVNRHAGRENVIIGGHMRCKIASELGMKEVPVYFVDLDEAQEKELNIRLNKNLGEFDFDLLANNFEMSDLKEFGFTDKEFGFDMEVGEKDDEVPEIPEEPQSQLGDLYELGQHRVLCGDSTKIEDVERLMEGVYPDVIHTDPPYGMNAVTKSGVLKERYGTDILGDDNPDVAKDAFRLYYGLYPDAKQIWWGANYYSSVLPDSECWLVWDKDNGQSDQTDCELAWANFRSVVRQFTQSSEKTNRVHPTQKPVSLMGWIIKRFNLTTKTVLDPFLGSGSTLIACEKTNRTCYGMEIDPKYVDVIVKRWEDFTGKKAIKK